MRISRFVNGSAGSAGTVDTMLGDTMGWTRFTPVHYGNKRVERAKYIPAHVQNQDVIGFGTGSVHQRVFLRRLTNVEKQKVMTEKNETILVVDDDAKLRFAAARILKNAGYAVFEAATGQECLHVLQEQSPDIILLDVLLPDGNGVEICRHLKETQRKPQSYIILLSGIRTTSDYQAEGLEAGADGYIVRPVSNRELLARIQSMLRLKRAEDRLKEYSERLEELIEERTQKLREAQEKLIRQEKLAALGQMAGSVGHELRTPLATIANAVYYLKMIRADADTDTREYLDIIASEAGNAEKIITDLLDFARIKSLAQQSVQVSDVVERLLAKYPSPERLRVVVAIPDDMPALYVDAAHLEQVLLNLVNNAYQAMLEGGTLTISARIEATDVAIVVADTGCGISEEHLNKIFDPLFTTKPKGIGLGLAVCKNLIETNGGTITVHSEQEKGATFTLLLPVAPEEDAS